jgi:hypothetical protein
MSEAAQARSLDIGSECGRLRADGWQGVERINGTTMDEKIIQTKRGLYGQVNITLPLPVKVSLFDLQKKTGLKKAEFLRLALTTGLVELSTGISITGDSLPAREEDSLPECDRISGLS